MDTVKPGIGIEPVIEDGIIRSKGNTILGGDDKSGIAAILKRYVFCAIASKRTKPLRLLSLCMKKAV